MAFTNSAIFSIEVLAFVDLVVTGSAMADGVVGAKHATSVEGTTVVTVGIAVVEVAASSLCLD